MKKKIGIDIGYGHTKVMFNNKVFKLPSAVSIVKTKLVDSNESINFEGKEYYVGSDALSDAIKTRDYSFIYTYSPLIIYNVFKELNIVDELNEYEIHTGLSLYDIEKSPEFKKEFKNRREEFVNRISKFSINNESYTPKIKLFAQGQGVWHDYCLTHGYIEKGVEVVFDIGYRTNDIIIFKDGSPSKSESNADDKGVNVVINELKTFLNKEYDITFSEQEVVEILNKKELLIYGKPKDLTFKIDEIIDSYFDIIYSSLKSDYGKILKSSVRVVFSGGGAYLLENFKHRLPENVVFDINRDFEFANVRGYYNG
jgi:plasmid segregation protein ParM